MAASTELQPKVLAAVERAHSPDGAVVLVFDYPAETAPRVPVLNVNYDLFPAARLVTSSEIETYPVFAGWTVRCSPKGVAIDWLATPLYDRIWLAEEGTAKLQPYSNVVFVDVGTSGTNLISSRARMRAGAGGVQTRSVAGPLVEPSGRSPAALALGVTRRSSERKVPVFYLGE